MSLIENHTCFFTHFYKITTLNILMIQTVSNVETLTKYFSSFWWFQRHGDISPPPTLLFLFCCNLLECLQLLNVLTTTTKKPHYNQNYENSTLQTICSDSFSLTTILHLSQPPTAHWHRGMFRTSLNVMIMMWSRWGTSHSLLTTRSPLLSHTDV